MVSMALDHARDFFGDPRVDPTAPGASGALFFTRWLTHFCAPTFVFLAGTAAFLYGARPGRTRGELSRFLLSRGVWLIVLELTLISFAWLFSFELHLVFVQVIAAIGVAMIALAGLVHLPRVAMIAIGLALVAGHNLLDPVLPADLGSAAWVWVLLHEGSGAGGPLVAGNWTFWVQYPLLPWIGVMALGYGIGPLFQLERTRRRRSLMLLGTLVTLAFVLLRWLDGYGEPTQWRAADTTAESLIAFLNCTKYPPSLAYLGMTLGPALVALGLADREPRWLGRFFVTLGRVPLFYYVLHLFAINACAGLYTLVREGEFVSTLGFMMSTFFRGGTFPEWFGNGNDLPTIYLAWILIVLAIYPLCHWYAGFKRRHRWRILSYL